ncbi:MAG: hypothetical protein PHD29_03730 [bacterium]|nr:hypothetical protein [bacterium]MDD5755811.1 hypothetical protein [bacterium]
MKKLLVLVVTVLAIVGLASMAYADTTIFGDSLAYAFANWQGSNQDNYGTTTTPNLHSITESVVTSPWSGVGDPIGNTVLKIDFDMNTVAGNANESWSGHLMTAPGGVKLSGVSRYTFKIRGDAATSGTPQIDKLVCSDANSNLINIVNPGYAVPDSSAWVTFTTDANFFAGKNMSGVPIPFGVYMTSSANASVTNGTPGLPNGNRHVIFYLDDVKFLGGSSGSVLVTMMTGVIGVQIEGNINFGQVTAATALNSADLIGDKFFTVTNVGNATINYDVNLFNPGGWTAEDPGHSLSTPNLVTEQDRYALYGLFTQQFTIAPGLADYQADDAITTAPQMSGSSKYSFPDGTSQGVGINAGDIRQLYIGLYTPLLSSVSTTQQISIAVSAVTP